MHSLGVSASFSPITLVVSVQQMNDVWFCQLKTPLDLFVAVQRVDPPLPAFAFHALSLPAALCSLCSGGVDLLSSNSAAEIKQAYFPKYLIIPLRSEANVGALEVYANEINCGFPGSLFNYQDNFKSAERSPSRRVEHEKFPSLLFCLGFDPGSWAQMILRLQWC